MAVIEKIRVKLGVLITVLIAIALLSFIIDPATLETAFSFMSSKNKVGEIDGKGVDYTDFQKRVDYYTAITQMSTGSSAISEEQNTAIQNMAWQWFLDQMLFIKNAELAGISVGGDEVLDLLYAFVKDENHAVLMSSHIVEDLEKIVDDILHGRTEDQGLFIKGFYPNGRTKYYAIDLAE